MRINAFMKSSNAPSTLTFVEQKVENVGHYSATVGQPHPPNLPNLPMYKNNIYWIKHRKNCEIALTPGIPSSPGIPGLWSLAEIVKFGRNCEIWSTPISLVWKGLYSELWINGQTQNFSRIAIWGILLVRSCFLITLIKCQKSQRPPFEGVH